MPSRLLSRLFKSDWHFFWCSLAAPNFYVAGVPFEESVFKRFCNTNQFASVIDPIYGCASEYPIYALEEGGRAFEIAYAEHTPGVYLAYATADTLPFCTPRFKWDSTKSWIRVDAPSQPR